MSVRFSETLLRTQQALSVQDWYSRLREATIVRDVKGQIHLFLEGYEPQESEQDELNRALSGDGALGPYWTGDIWLPKDEPAPAQAIVQIIRGERKFLAAGPEGLRWHILERHVSKQSWTASHQPVHPPWPIEESYAGQAPAIVSFFSFKGGVGRTTAAAAAALALARHGQRVALVDLDLEAPGLASVFLGPDEDQTGVIDYLIEKPIQGEGWMLRESVHSITHPALIGETGTSLRLLPAGAIDPDYLQKLSRVDVQNLAEGHLAAVLR